MTVEVDQGQPVVANGPCRWVRHPSYTGLLLITTGFGIIAFASWLFLVLCAVLPPLALLRRIKGRRIRDGADARRALPHLLGQDQASHPQGLVRSAWLKGRQPWQRMPGPDP